MAWSPLTLAPISVRCDFTIISLHLLATASQRNFSHCSTVQKGIHRTMHAIQAVRTIHWMQRIQYSKKPARSPHFPAGPESWERTWAPARMQLIFIRATDTTCLTLNNTDGQHSMRLDECSGRPADQYIMTEPGPLNAILACCKLRGVTKTPQYNCATSRQKISFQPSIAHLKLMRACFF